MKPARTLAAARRALIALAVAGAAVAGAHAQSYPSKLLTLVVPYPAGGPSDVIARTIQPGLQKLLGQTLIIDNVGGAGGGLGVQKMLLAPPDGHTMLLGSPMELVQTPLALASVKHKPEDLRVVGVLVNTNMILLARPDLPANTVDELAALAKKPDTKQISYGSVGAGSMYHLLAEKFSEQTGAKMLHVPYKGGAPLMQDLIGGQIDIVFLPLAGNVVSMIEGGKVKALGIASEQRHPRFPNLPTISESKAVKNFSYELWAGVEVAKGVPDEVAAKINGALNEVLKLPEVRKELESGGPQAAQPMGLAELAKLYATDTARYRAIAKSINLQAQ